MAAVQPEDEELDGLAQLAARTGLSSMGHELHPFGTTPPVVEDPVHAERPVARSVDDEYSRRLDAINARDDARRRAKAAGDKKQAPPIPLRVSDDWRSLKAHPLADMLPMMDAATKAALSASIMKHGCTEPGVLLDGMILDGRNRHAICKALDVSFPTRQFDPCRDGDPFDFVLRHNVERRHLTKLQLCMVALPFVTTEHGGDRKSVSRGTITPCFSLEQAAERFGVSYDYLKKVKALLRHCHEQERDDLFQGRVTLAKMRDAKLPRSREPSESETDGPSIAAPPVPPEPTSIPEQGTKRLTDSSSDEEVFAGWRENQEVPSNLGGSVAQHLREEVPAAAAVSDADDMEEEAPMQHVQKTPPPATLQPTPSLPTKAMQTGRRFIIEVPASAIEVERFAFQLRRLVHQFQLNVEEEPT